MRGEINSNLYEVSFWLKISLCSVSYLLVFTWIEAKWNSNRYGLNIGHFDRNEIPNRHEIFVWPIFTQSEVRFSCDQYLPKVKWVSADSLDIAFNAHERLKLIAGVISFWSFWRKRNFIEKQEYWRMSIKISGCLNYSRNESSCEQNLFSRRFEYKFISPLMWTYSKSQS